MHILAATPWKKTYAVKQDLFLPPAIAVGAAPPAFFIFFQAKKKAGAQIGALMVNFKPQQSPAVGGLPPRAAAARRTPCHGSLSVTLTMTLA